MQILKGKTSRAAVYFSRKTADVIHAWPVQAVKCVCLAYGVKWRQQPLQFRHWIAEAISYGADAKMVRLIRLRQMFDQAGENKARHDLRLEHAMLMSERVALPIDVPEQLTEEAVALYSWLQRGELAHVVASLRSDGYEVGDSILQRSALRVMRSNPLLAAELARACEDLFIRGRILVTCASTLFRKWQLPAARTLVEEGWRSRRASSKDIA